MKRRDAKRLVCRHAAQALAGYPPAGLSGDDAERYDAARAELVEELERRGGVHRKTVQVDGQMLLPFPAA